MTFSGNQLLHGSYGGTDGIAVGVENSLSYGYTRLDACDRTQSQFSSKLLLHSARSQSMELFFLTLMSTIVFLAMGKHKAR